MQQSFVKLFFAMICVLALGILAMGCGDDEAEDLDSSGDADTDTDTDTDADVDTDTETGNLADINWIEITGAAFEMGDTELENDVPVDIDTALTYQALDTDSNPLFDTDGDPVQTTDTDGPQLFDTDSDPVITPIPVRGPVAVSTPVHTVNVPTFEMLETEVTVEQYKACYKAGECPEPLAARCDDATTCELGSLLDVGCGDLNNNNYYADLFGDDWDKHPMNCILFEMATAFCEYIDGRLPSEAEWEFAARNGAQGDLHPWGPAVPTCNEAVIDEARFAPENFDTDTGNDVPSAPGCGAGHTMPVCSKPAGNTADALCDMIGNVHELTEDCWHTFYQDFDPDTDPTNGNESPLPLDGSAWVDPGGCNTDFVGLEPIEATTHVSRGGAWGPVPVPLETTANETMRSTSRVFVWEDWHILLPKDVEAMFQWGSQYGFRCAR